MIEISSNHETEKRISVSEGGRAYGSDGGNLEDMCWRRENI